MDPTSAAHEHHDDHDAPAAIAKRAPLAAALTAVAVQLCRQIQQQRKTELASNRTTQML
jgi:hypothetical protein